MGKLSDKDMDQLEQWIGGGPKTFDLLYSITRDGCVGQTFHSKCDNQGPTVTVLYNPQGSVYGGYTGISWTTSGDYTDSAAFLYRLYLNNKLSPIKFPRKDSSSYDLRHAGVSYGPIFGSGHDLYTFNGTINISGGTFALNGHARFGDSYNMQNVQSDDVNNGTLNVTELEVYKVTDGERHPVSVEPWRFTSRWEEGLLGNLVEEVVSFQGLEDINVDKANLLLIGPVGAGKSSFFNSVSSIMLGRISQAARCGSADESLTSAYRQYRVRAKRGGFLNFKLCDTRGLEENQGLDILELNYLLEGHIPDFYEFNTTNPITPDTTGFLAHPTAADKMHCVIFVIDATTLDIMSAKILQKIRSFQKRINQRGVPFVVVLTKVDKLCRDVDTDIKKVFRSSRVKDEVEKAAQIFGLPRINILPVKNYENESVLQEDTSILILLALQQILHFAEDYMMQISEKLEAVEIAKKRNTKS